jgi:hypothetical protein
LNSWAYEIVVKQKSKNELKAIFIMFIFSNY